MDSKQTKTRTVTGKLKAWLPDHASHRDMEALRGNDGDRIADVLAYTKHDMKSIGYTLIGEAEITVHIVDEQAIVENKVESLRAEKQKVLAEATNNATEIERQIQTLLAITYEPEAS